MLGNNMFAYCLNNPVNGLDSSGYITEHISNRFSYKANNTDGGSLSATNSQNYSRQPSSNTSEATVREVLKQYGIAFYNGTLVVSVDALGYSAASYGLILMGSNNLERSDFADVLNHEYGHAVHYSQIGPIDYLLTTAIPSLIGAGIANMNQSYNKVYYNQPWERTADYLGKIKRDYLPGANTAGAIFYLYTLLVSYITPY